MPIVVVKKKKSRSRRKTKQKQAAPSGTSAMGRALRTLGSAGGGYLGAYLGQPAMGAMAGKSLGAALSRWMGSGDYTVSENSIVRAGPVIPMMHKESQSIIVHHKEYLCPVLGSQSFNVQQAFELNPGIATTFPWLSRVATCFQEYSIRGAVFHYIPTSGIAVSGTNPAIGSVLLQTTYRATDSAPGSKVEMMNEYWASEIPPSETGVHPIECSPKENPFKVQYIRSIPLATDSPLMYDLGKTFLATQGMPADGNPVGDLWITYEIELRKPVVKSDVATNQYYAQGQSNLSTAADPFTSMVWSPGSPVTSAGTAITFVDMPAGTYWVVFRVAMPGEASSLTAVDLQISPTATGASVANWKRTVLGGGTPTLNNAVATFNMTVDSAKDVVLTFTTPTITPSTGLRMTVLVLTTPVV